MRTRWAMLVVVAALLGGLAWGWVIDRQPVPARPADLTVPADAAWYAALPLAADAATAAFLARVPADMRARGEAYSQTRVLALGARVFSLLASTLLLCMTGLAAALRTVATRACRPVVLRDLLTGLLYFIVLYALTLPAEVYATFVRQHQFGFSAQPFSGWLADNLVNWAVITIFYLVAVVALYTGLRYRPDRWAPWAVGIYFLLRLAYLAATPSLIEPLTNDFRPLPAGSQREQVLALAHASGISDAAVVTGNASVQTRMLNAHVSGFGSTARISIDDNTLTHTSDATLRAVTAHEIGHFVLRHDLLMTVCDSLIMALGFSLMAFALPRLLNRFGQRWQIEGPADAASLPLLWGLFMLWGYVSLPLNNAEYRMFEHQADMYSLGAAGEPLGLAEFMIHDADIARLQPTWFEYAFFFDHPGDVERVAAAMTWREQVAKLPPHGE